MTTFDEVEIDETLKPLNCSTYEKERKTGMEKDGERLRVERNEEGSRGKFAQASRRTRGGRGRGRLKKSI